MGCRQCRDRYSVSCDAGERRRRRMMMMLLLSTFSLRLLLLEIVFCSYATDVLAGNTKLGVVLFVPGQAALCWCYATCRCRSSGLPCRDCYVCMYCLRTGVGSSGLCAFFECGCARVFEFETMDNSTICMYEPETYSSTLFGE